MTREEFLTHEIYVWGEDYIFDLLDKGYSLTNTSGGWKWLLPVTAVTTTTVALDNGAASCYAGSVGVG